MRRLRSLGRTLLAGRGHAWEGGRAPRSGIEATRATSLSTVRSSYLHSEIDGPDNLARKRHCCDVGMALQLQIFSFHLRNLSVAAAVSAAELKKLATQMIVLLL